MFSPPHYTSLKIQGLHWSERLMRAGGLSQRLPNARTGSKEWVPFIPCLRWSLRGLCIFQWKEARPCPHMWPIHSGVIVWRGVETGVLHCVLLCDSHYRTPVWVTDPVDTSISLMSLPSLLVACTQYRDTIKANRSISLTKKMLACRWMLLVEHFVFIIFVFTL